MPRDADEAGRPPRPESKTEETPRGAASLAELLTSEKLKRLALPYPGYLAAWRLVKGHGKCIQGVNGRSTHRGTLCYSFDFKLAVGTPVLAARGGTIAAVVDHFRGGGAKAHLAPRANFVAVRHSDGSYARYYHLKEKGSLYKVGERVGRGQQIAWSGNTGYTGGPHLHFDLVNLLPEETSTLRIVSPKHCRKRLQSVAAAFSCELPSTPLRCKVVHVPNDAVNGDGLRIEKPWIALSDRDPASTFSEKIAFLAEQGACAAIISNNRSGPELFAMGGCETASPVPACLISKEHGINVYKWNVGEYDACVKGIATVEAELGPVDVLVNPEQIVTHDIARLIDNPGALQVMDFADGTREAVLGSTKLKDGLMYETETGATRLDR